MFRKLGRPPEDRESRRKEIWAAVGPLIVKHGARKLTMRQAAAAAYVSVGSLYNYFPTKHSLVTFGLDHDTLNNACTEFFARAERPGVHDPSGAARDFSRFLAGQVFFIRPSMLAALEIGGAGGFMAALEAVLTRGDKHIEERVLAHSDARAGDAPSVARLVRRVVLSGLLDTSVTHAELERELFAAFDGVTIRSKLVLAPNTER